MVPLEMVLEVLEGSAPIAELPSFEEFLIVFIIGSVISVVIFLIGFVAFFGALITLIVLKKSTTKSGNAKKDRCKSRYNELEEEIQELLKQKNTYIEKTERYVSFLPSCYRNPQAIGFMLQSVTNLRADTLKEVINLYEHELHMLEQERILNNVAEMQRIQNENTMYALNAIQQNQERINSNLRDIHTWQIFSTFSD